jgi:hypothetical protein
VLDAVKCDVLLTPHPELSDVFGKLQKREAGHDTAFREAPLCRQYVESYRKKLRERVDEERKLKAPGSKA